jgi:hypothetical protein
LTSPQVASYYIRSFKMICSGIQVIPKSIPQTIFEAAVLVLLM